MTFLIIVTSLLSISLLINFYLSYKLLNKSKQSKVKVQNTLELDMFLKDLLDGQALVKVVRVASEDIFLRSPRGR